MSVAISPYAPAALLEDITQYITNRFGPYLNEDQSSRARLAWTPRNTAQEMLLENLRRITPELDHLKHFWYRSGPSSGPSDIHTSGTLRLPVEWITAGEEANITIEDRPYPAARISGRQIAFFEHPDHSHPLVRIKTSRRSFSDPDYGRYLFVTMLDEIPSSNASLATTVRTFSKGHRFLPRPDSVVLPMVSLDHTEPVNELLGLQVQSPNFGDPSTIEQATQQIRLYWSEAGRAAEPRSARIQREAERESEDYAEYAINQPFLFWIKWEELSQPLVIGYVTPESWLKPLLEK